MDAEETKPRHPVRVVAQKTGLNPVTLRAWERRYGVVEPSRSEGGQRLYSDADVERLTLLRALTTRGHSIGLIGTLPMEEARALLRADRRIGSTEGGESPAAMAVREALALTRVMDADGLLARLRIVGVSLGAVAFLDDVVGPFLTAVGEEWAEGRLSPAEEHAAAAAVDSALDWLVESARPVADGPSLVVSTLPGELHRLGARMAAATATLEGWRVSYLGAELPAAEIARAARTVGASAVAISVVARTATRDAHRELTELRESLPPRVQLLLGGGGARSLAGEGVPDGVVVIDDLAGLRRELGRHR